MSLFGCPSAEALAGSAMCVHRIERSRIPCERRLRQLAVSAPASRNTRRLRAVRGKWDANDRCDPRTCSACLPCSPFRRALSFPDELMAFLVCAKVQPWEIESTGFPPSPPRRMRTCSRRGTACSCRTRRKSTSSRTERQGCRDGGGGSCDLVRRGSQM